MAAKRVWMIGAPAARDSAPVAATARCVITVSAPAKTLEMVGVIILTMNYCRAIWSVGAPRRPARFNFLYPIVQKVETRNARPTTCYDAERFMIWNSRLRFPSPGKRPPIWDDNAITPDWYGANGTRTFPSPRGQVARKRGFD